MQPSLEDIPRLEESNSSLCTLLLILPQTCLMNDLFPEKITSMSLRRLRFPLPEARFPLAGLFPFFLGSDGVTASLGGNYHPLGARRFQLFHEKIFSSVHPDTSPLWASMCPTEQLTWPVLPVCPGMRGFLGYRPLMLTPGKSQAESPYHLGNSGLLTMDVVGYVKKWLLSLSVCFKLYHPPLKTRTSLGKNSLWAISHLDTQYFPSSDSRQ